MNRRCFLKLAGATFAAGCVPAICEASGYRGRFKVGDWVQHRGEGDAMRVVALCGHDLYTCDASPDEVARGDELELAECISMGVRSTVSMSPDVFERHAHVALNLWLNERVGKYQSIVEANKEWHAKEWNYGRTYGLAMTYWFNGKPI